MSVRNSVEKNPAKGIYAPDASMYTTSVHKDFRIEMSKPPKSAVNVTELRQNLPSYLREVKRGREIEVTSRGKVIARIIAGGDPHQEARERLLSIRKHCKVGDVVSPTGVKWDVES